MTVTNGLLLCLMVLVLLWVAAAAVFGPFDTASDLLSYFGFIAVTGFFGAAIAGIMGASSRGKESIWSTPVSPRVGALLINGMVAVFLCGIGLLTLLILHVKGSTTTVLGAIVALLAGAAFGRYLQKRSSSRSLLPYGLSFFGAFVVMLIAFIATGVGR